MVAERMQALDRIRLHEIDAHASQQIEPIAEFDLLGNHTEVEPPRQPHERGNRLLVDFIFAESVASLFTAFADELDGDEARELLRLSLDLLRLRRRKQLFGKGIVRLAERVGFEPTEPHGSTVFKTAAFDHSAISPLQKYNIF